MADDTLWAVREECAFTEMLHAIFHGQEFSVAHENACVNWKLDDDQSQSLIDRYDQEY